MTSKTCKFFRQIDSLSTHKSTLRSRNWNMKLVGVLSFPNLESRSLAAASFSSGLLLSLHLISRQKQRHSAAAGPMGASAEGALSGTLTEPVGPGMLLRTASKQTFRPKHSSQTIYLDMNRQRWHWAIPLLFLDSTLGNSMFMEELHIPNH